MEFSNCHFVVFISVWIIIAHATIHTMTSLRLIFFSFLHHVNIIRMRLYSHSAITITSLLHSGYEFLVAFQCDNLLRRMKFDDEDDYDNDNIERILSIIE